MVKKLHGAGRVNYQKGFCHLSGTAQGYKSIWHDGSTREGFQIESKIQKRMKKITDGYK